jgi:two-component system chemotaxis sensor kinase CheA
MSELDDVVREFLVESHEGLDQLDRDLVTLEQRPRDRDLLAGVFRCIHTIKGTCGFLGFSRLEAVSHVGESLLSLLRDGVLVLTPEITSALLQLVDAIRQILAGIETTGQEADADYTALVELLTRLQSPDESPAAALATTVAAEGRGSAVSDTNIRVDVGLLDKLMNLVGELVLARNQILQYTATHEDSAFAATSQRLNLITTELQEGVMKTRMQPIGNIWGRLPRMVRDLATACGKQVAIEMEGKETELDKTVIEAIKDPLTHIVRNSVDHGLELPAVRVAAGKPAEGRLVLRAFHEGGQVNLEICDDGAGINVERVREKAVERGLVSAEQAARMSEREVHHLIFLPGFSTAETVSNISGRGVGMDVVRTNIEKIGGTVDVQSVAGQGTTLRIKIPLTLAIIPALTITAAGDRYAIPQVNLLELVRLEGEDARKGIEMIHDAPVYRLRGRLLPLAHLSRELQVGDGRAAADGAVNIVVLRADDRTFGLIVDEINDTEEIVVKPLGQQLKGIPIFAGATIMADGRVALILDVLALAQRARIVTKGRDRSHLEAAPGESTAVRGGERQTLLVLGLGDDRRLAIPLSLVARLEELPRALLETAGSHEVVQYRGEILPLLRLSHLLDIPSKVDPGSPLQVVVYADGGHQTGLVVDCIVDIVEEAITLQRPIRRGDLIGSAVIQQRVTDLLDVQSLVRRAYPGWADAVAPREVVA